MTEEQKQALIDWLKEGIELREEYGFNGNLLASMRVALAALTAQPVKLPKGFNPAIGDIFDKTAPVMRRDATDGKWLHKADVTKILNELGHKVQE